MHGLSFSPALMRMQFASALHDPTPMMVFGIRSAGRKRMRQGRNSPIADLVPRQIAIRASKRFIICCKGMVRRAVEKWRIVKLRLWQLAILMSQCVTNAAAATASTGSAAAD